MSPIHVLSVVTLTLVLTFTLGDPVKTVDNEVNSGDETMTITELINDIRRVAIGAKKGIYLDALRKDVLDLQSTATNLISGLSGKVSESDVQSTVKMAALGTGSHEILTLLLADDALGVLNGRLSLSLAFLEQLAQLMEDDLSLGADLGPHLTALVFGTDVTLDIIRMANETVTSMAHQDAANALNAQHTTKGGSKLRVRRQFRTNFGLGRGWSAGTRGVQWDSSNGRYTFNARPTFRGIRPDGFRASFTIRF